jgi:hypothetical protein
VITDLRLIFLSGIPATGKTFFGQWLAREHDFIHVEIENKSVRETLGIDVGWDTLKAHRQPGPLIKAVKHLGPRVVFDWGFPPGWLFVVSRFAERGAELWWLDGDRARAREEFGMRTPGALGAFDQQLSRVTRSWSGIGAVFGPRQIEVLSPSGERMPPESIWATMNQDAASSHSLIPEASPAALARGSADAA